MENISVTHNQKINDSFLLKTIPAFKSGYPTSISFDDISSYQYGVAADSVTEMVDVCERIESLLISWNVPTEKIQNFCIALGEAINNAQEHGFEFRKDQKVSVNLFNIANKFFLAGVESTGETFQLNKVKKLLREDNPLKTEQLRGRGFSLIKKAVDLLYINTHKNKTEVLLGIYSD